MSKIPKKYKEQLKKKKNKPKKKKNKAAGAFGKYKRFAIDGFKHIASGMPTCTQEQINERLEICKGCKWFGGTYCKKCGCACGSGKKFLNKLAWADQKCPVGKWDKIKND